mmetsp:Transcript_865/g.2861  ORF Transcript_865/g.2861 Transcript_865/m.2861 type:complete len:259 (-) Transcript_865:884-1660(-)
MAAPSQIRSPHDNGKAKNSSMRIPTLASMVSKQPGMGMQNSGGSRSRQRSASGVGSPLLSTAVGGSLALHWTVIVAPVLKFSVAPASLCKRAARSARERALSGSKNMGWSNTSPLGEFAVCRRCLRRPPPPIWVKIVCDVGDPVTVAVASTEASMSVAVASLPDCWTTRSTSTAVFWVVTAKKVGAGGRGDGATVVCPTVGLAVGSAVVTGTLGAAVGCALVLPPLGTMQRVHCGQALTAVRGLLRLSLKRKSVSRLQ